ncbi:NlpC/P60 family protein [Ferrimicrobium sp.]|uniref:NlpC/P60 family protein n=1 Tax=Ferrimicrobium sp. TaxID=2926050 RepID=UPI00344E17D5
MNAIPTTLPALTDLSNAFSQLASQATVASGPSEFLQTLSQVQSTIGSILNPTAASGSSNADGSSATTSSGTSLATGLASLGLGSTASTAGVMNTGLVTTPALTASAALAGSSSVDAVGGASSSASPVTQAVANALGEIGVPYVWGGSSPSTGFDCSGLVQWAYGQAGIDLPRVADQQEQVGTQVASLAEAQPGDLVFYGNPAYHVGIYLGNGYMVDAPETGQTVQIQPVGDPTEIRSVAPTTNGSEASAPADLSSIFAAATQAYNLPPNLLTSVATAESGMNPSAVSSAGAEGLMQIMPQTAASLGVNPMNPNQAIYGAAELLSQKLTKFGSVPLALAAYNAGDGAVEQYGGIPPYTQTQNYVTEVMGLMGGQNVTSS